MPVRAFPELRTYLEEKPWYKEGEKSCQSTYIHAKDKVLPRTGHESPEGE
jgi:hypothetical protein